jgi:hypothetical protein
MKEYESGDETEKERTTEQRHLLRGPSGAIGSTTTRTRTSISGYPEARRTNSQRGVINADPHGSLLIRLAGFAPRTDKRLPRKEKNI